MLVLPMRSQDSSPKCSNRDSYTTSIPTFPREPSPHTSELRKQVADAMLSVMPSTRPPAHQRPKLSLHTAIPPSPPTKRSGASLHLSTDSPTTRNTQANAFEAPPPTPSSAVQPHVTFPSNLISPPSSNPSSTASGHSPFSHTAPYLLPIGTHSILRNSLLPRRHPSATMARTPRRMFQPVKRVAFPEQLVDILPTRVIEESPDVGPDTEPVAEPDAEPDTVSTEDEHQRRREEIQAEDGHATPVHGRRKRRREWIWRPLDDDILVQRELCDTLEGFETPTRIPLPESASEEDDSSKVVPWERDKDVTCQNMES